MSDDRSMILKESLKVKPTDVRWHFIADYYDGPISGLLYFRERICRFCCFPEDIPDQHIYVVQELTPEELKEELRIKEKFENLVGTHGSFGPDGRPLAGALRDESSLKRFYDEEKFEQRVASDQPVIAWFDVSESGKL
jgi:hypothetical protein